MADDSVAVVDLERCQPDRCNYECANFCPPNRTGKECIVTREERHGDEPHDGDPDQISISEEICLGETCGICVEKCPFDAIEIINLPQELEEEPVHRYGENAFRLYGLPVPEPGKVTGLLGPNGIGKSTAVNALAEELVPNLGEYADPPGWEAVLDRYRGTELQDYLRAVRDGEVSVARKPQYVDQIPEQFDGRARKLLEGTDERGVLDELLDRLSVRSVVDQTLDSLSGGELQRVALAATLARDADFYFVDELTPYLDISQRVAAARLVRELAADDRAVLVVEHDLAVLDLLADSLHLAYGEPGAYGVITPPKSVRNGINQYLEGYLPNENMRIRQEAIEFEAHAPRPVTAADTLVEYPAMTKTYGDGGGFSLDVAAGELRQNEVLGVVGPNGIGKSTFAKLLAGRTAPDDAALDLALDIAYKPQYVEADQRVRVDAFLSSITDDVGTSYWNTEIADPLQLGRVMEQQLTDLSGGERQRVAIAACLSRDADLYLLDEPSAHLDVEQRVLATRTIRRFAENNECTALVIDHDIYLVDLVSDRLMVFGGDPAEHGRASPAQEMREGMNDFLADLDVTFRRDENTGRPRINKPESRLDRRQKSEGEYYYTS
jgi:ATP-binding cassette subfamily E protein 1